MLPRHILCVLALVLCCSYVSLVSAASHESTGKFNNLMHGVNSSLFAQTLGMLMRHKRNQLRREADRAIGRLNEAKREAEREIVEGPVLERNFTPTLSAAYRARDTIRSLNIQNKEELMRLADDAVQKASSAYTKAGGISSFAESDLGEIQTYIQKVNDSKRSVNLARDYEENKIRNEIKAGSDKADYYLNLMKQRREKATKEIEAAKKAVANVEEALGQATEKQKQQQEREKVTVTVTDTSSTPGTQPHISQKENTQVSQSLSAKGPAPESVVTVKKELPQPEKEERVTAVTREAAGSAPASVNISDSSSVQTDSQSSLPNNTAKEEISEGAQEKEGQQAPEVKAPDTVNESPIKTNERNISKVKPVVTTENNKTQNGVLVKDAQEPTVNTETKETKSEQPNLRVQGSTVNTKNNQSGSPGNMNEAADLNHLSTPSIRNDMDGTNIIGWVPSLPIMFILLTVFPCVLLR